MPASKIRGMDGLQVGLFVEKSTSEVLTMAVAAGLLKISLADEVHERSFRLQESKS